MSAKPAKTNEAVLHFQGRELVAPLLERVVGMLVARTDCPIDRLDDAMLLTDAIGAHAPEFTNGDDTVVAVTTTPEHLELRVGPLDDKAAQGLIASSQLPEVGNVIERMSSSVKHEDDTLLMTVTFG